MATSISKPVTLGDPDTYDDFIIAVEMLSNKAYKVWPLINPDIEEEPFLLERWPPKPKPSDIEGGAESIKDFEKPISLEIFKMMLTDARELEAKAKLIHDNLQAINTWMINSVDKRHLDCFKNKDSVWQVLRALKAKVAPTDAANELNAQTNYLKAKVFDKKQPPERWIQAFEVATTKGIEQNLPETTGNRPVLDFAYAIRNIDEKYASSLKFSLQRAIAKKKPVPLDRAISEFRDHIRLEIAQGAYKQYTGSQHTAGGASFQGNQQNSSRICVCKDQHEFNKCKYLNPALRPANWIGKPATYGIINNHIASRPENTRDYFKNRYGYDGGPLHQRQGLPPPQPALATEFQTQPAKPVTRSTTPARGYRTDGKPNMAGFNALNTSREEKTLLYNAWVLDSGTDIHVINDAKRSDFQKTRDSGPSDRLSAGKESYAIEAFGTAMVNIMDDTGAFDLQLLEVALAPGFVTNLVAMDLINDIGIHWSSQTPSKLTYNNLPYCNLYKVGKHWTFEVETQYKAVETVGNLALVAACKTSDSEVSSPHINTNAGNIQDFDDLNDFDNEEEEFDEYDISEASYHALATRRQNQGQKSQRKNAHQQKSKTPRHETITAEKLHRILGHAASEAIDHVQDCALDITVDFSVPCPSTMECNSCAMAKATKNISRRLFEHEIPSEFKLLSSLSWDMIVMHPGYNGHKYFSHLKCELCDFMYYESHAKKSDVPGFFRRGIDFFTKTLGYPPPRKIRLDGETLGGAFYTDIAEAEGILTEKTAPHTSDQNGGNERQGRTITTKARAMRIEAKLPAFLWPETMRHACFVMMRTPLKKLGWKTPWEVVTGSKVRYSTMEVLGAAAYYLVKTQPEGRKAKLDPRALLGYYVGSDSTNIHRIWSPSTDKIFRTRDVRFNSNKLYDPRDLDLGMMLREKTDQLLELLRIPDIDKEEVIEAERNPEVDIVYDSITVQMPSDWPAYDSPDFQHPTSPETSETGSIIEYNDDSFIQTLITPSPTPSENGRHVHFNEDPVPESAESPEAAEHPEPETFENALETIEQNTLAIPDAITLDTLDRGAEIDSQNIIGEGTGRSSRSANHVTSQTPFQQVTSFHTVLATAHTLVERTKTRHRDELPPCPKNRKEMLLHPEAEEFKAAELKEYQKLLDKNTFKLEDIANLHTFTKLIPLMTIYSRKFDVDGYLLSHKVRIVARGDLHHEEEDTYAATLAARTMRACMAICCAFNMETRQYDAVNAYPNAKLPNSIACRCVTGFEVDGKYLSCTGALYGFAISALMWYNKLSESLEDLGVHQVPGINCLFVNEWLTIIVYVDDVLCFYSSNHQAKFDNFEVKMLALYEFRKLGEVEHFLGIRVVRDRTDRKLWLVQDTYMEKLAAKHHITLDGKTPNHPIPSDLTKFEGIATPSQITGFQQRVGGINYPSTQTRPDIAKAVSKLSEFLRNPSPKHIDAADQCIKYMLATKYLAIEYCGQERATKIFLTYTDSAFANNDITRYSDFGSTFKLFNGLVDWFANKGKTVVLNTNEAELLSATQCGKLFIQWMRFFRNISFELNENSTIYCDNTATIGILTKEAPKLVTALKHVDIHQCWLRQEVQAGRIAVEWCSTDNMVADGFTKVLTGQKFKHFVDLLGLVDIRYKIE